MLHREGHLRGRVTFSRGQSNHGKLARTFSQPPDLLLVSHIGKIQQETLEQRLLMVILRSLSQDTELGKGEE